MAEFSKLVITNGGQALLAKLLSGAEGVEFTKMCTSTTQYTEAQLEGLEKLTNIKQTSAVSNVVRTNDTAVRVEAAFTNEDLGVGYYIYAIGLYAKDPDIGEILYGVTIETSGKCYMPAYNGVSVTSAYIRLVSTVGNADGVSLEVDSGAYATVSDLNELKAKISEKLGIDL